MVKATDVTSPPSGIELCDGRVTRYYGSVEADGGRRNAFIIERLPGGFRYWVSGMVIGSKDGRCREGSCCEIDHLAMHLPPSLGDKLVKLFRLTDPSGEQLRAIGCL